MAAPAQFWQLHLGTEYAGFKVYHYAAGTSTLLNVWQDSRRGTMLPNPATADSNGWIAFYGDGEYRLEITTSDGILIQVFDPIRITADKGTAWEALNGTTLPGVANYGAWSLFAQHDGADSFEQFWLSNGSTWLPVGANMGSTVVNVLDYGAAGDGVADDTTAIQAAMDAVGTAGAGMVLIPGVAAHYRTTDTVEIHSNTLVQFGGSYIKADPSIPFFSRGGILNMRATDEVTSNVTLLNPLIDASNTANNCIGAGSGSEIVPGGIGASVSNLRVIGGHVTGARMDQTNGGGKGLTFQRGIWDVNVMGTVIDNCGQALNTAAFWRNAQDVADPPPTIEFATNIMFNGIVATNCGRLYQHDDLVSGGSSGSDETTCQVSVTNISARNCGDPRRHYTWTGEFSSSIPVDGLGAGVFVFHGGTRLQIRNINVVNDIGVYSQIDSVFRGQCKYSEISNVYFEGPTRTVINGNSPDANSVQGTPDFWPFTDNTFTNIRVESDSLDYWIDCKDPVASGTLVCRRNHFDIRGSVPNLGLISDNATGTLQNTCHFSVPNGGTIRMGFLNAFKNSADDNDGDMANDFTTDGAEVQHGGTSWQWGSAKISEGTTTLLAGQDKALRLGYNSTPHLAFTASGPQVLDTLLFDEQASVPANVPGQPQLYVREKPADATKHELVVRWGDNDTDTITILGEGLKVPA